MTKIFVVAAMLLNICVIVSLGNFEDIAICDWACENLAYLHKIHTFKQWHLILSLFMVKMFCKLYLLSNGFVNVAKSFSSTALLV